MLGALNTFGRRWRARLTRRLPRCLKAMSAITAVEAIGVTWIVFAYYLLVRGQGGLPCLVSTIGLSWFFNKYVVGFALIVMTASAWIIHFFAITGVVRYGPPKGGGDDGDSQGSVATELSYGKLLWCGLKVNLLLIVVTELTIDLLWIIGLPFCES